MEQQTRGKVIAVAKQWWFKVNTKPLRAHAFDGAIFPHIIKVAYAVDGKTYIRRKWIGAGKPVPPLGSEVTVLYRADKPHQGKIL